MKTLTPKRNRLDDVKQKANNLLFIHHFIVFALVLAVSLYLMCSINPKRLIFPACLMLVGTFAWCFWSWFRVTGSIFDPYTLFMASVFLFNGSAAFLYLFHYSFSDSLGVIFSETVLLKSLFLVTLSTAAIHYGSLSAISRTGKETRNREGIFNKEFMYDAIYRIGIALLILSIVPFIVFIRDNIFIVVESGYGGIFQREAPTGYGAWSNVLSGFFVPGIFFLLIGGKERRHARIISIVLISIYAVVYLFIGSRNRALLPLVVFLWLWNYYVSKFKRLSIFSVIILVIVLTFLVFPLIKTARAVPGEERASVQSYLQGLRELKEPVIAPFAEMGGSFRTIAYALSYVPKERNYDYGASYLYSLFTVAPNFIWDVHPTIARGTWSDWLVKKVDPYTAERGGGYGFSFIAEAYANFGWLGITLFLFAGYYLAKLTLKAIKAENPAIIALFACFLPQLLFFARGESALLVRSVAWYALFPYFCTMAVYRSKMRGSTRLSAIQRTSSPIG